MLQRIFSLALGSAILFSCESSDKLKVDMSKSKWSLEEVTNYYNQCVDSSMNNTYERLKKSQANEFCGCVITKVSAEHDYDAFRSSELEIMKAYETSLIQVCEKKAKAS